MQPFKTYEELMQHYWGVIVPMAKAAGINPHGCVKHDSEVWTATHPRFTLTPYERYTFAITILEGKPVFVGDKLWGKNIGKWITVPGGLDTIYYSESIVSWAPPTKKRTFTVELLEEERNFLMHMTSTSYSKVLIGLYEKLSIARNKE